MKNGTRKLVVEVVSSQVVLSGTLYSTGDTLSVKSWGSKGARSLTSRASASTARPALAREHGSIMRHVILKAVSSQLCSAIERVSSGSPTCMATTHLIAVGTQGGFVLVFDSSQVIKWFLGGLELGGRYGAVASLAFNRESTRLLAGFARGQMVEWDVTTGKVGGGRGTGYKEWVILGSVGAD